MSPRRSERVGEEITLRISIPGAEQATDYEECTGLFALDLGRVLGFRASEIW
jgi:hypothetical protein